MKTIDDAKRALELFERRRQISSVASEFSVARGPFVVSAPKASKNELMGSVSWVAFNIDKLEDELRKLISAEASPMIAEIDSELRELGVAEG